jgi:hypothetical protein
MSLLTEIATGLDLKKADQSDAGSRDVTGKAGADEIGFAMTRNTINSNGEITGSDVADYLEKAADLNDEVETVPFGLEDSDGDIVKVYVNAEQADKFEEALKKLLGIEDDIEEVVNKLALDFDIVDVVWPKSKEDEGDDTSSSVDLDAAGEYDGLGGGEDDDEMDVVAEYDPLSSLDEGLEEVDGKAATRAFGKLAAIAMNLKGQGPAGVHAVTGFDPKTHTKAEMISKHLHGKYPDEVELVKTWHKQGNITLPDWLAK